jgi:tryptophan synthase beta chain
LINKKGYYGEFGGSFVPNELQEEMDRIERAWIELKKDPEFASTLEKLRKDYQGRPTPLTFADNLSKLLGGARIYLKREDLNFTGAHKINHVIGECLLAKKMGKKKVMCETGAGQHGLALAAVATKFNLECEIYMGSISMEKQAQNVAKMRLLGAKVIPVLDGGLCAAVDCAFEAYRKNYRDTLFCIGSIVGPHPYPEIVEELQSVVGKEVREQLMEAEGKLPDVLVACVSGGSNAIGLFTEFLDEDSVKIFGAEAGGYGIENGKHAATITYGKAGIMQGNRTLIIMDGDGLPAPVHSIASGLDHPSVGPQHAYLAQIGRVKYVAISDAEALNAYKLLSRTEGIIPALESSHAIALTIKLAKKLSSKECIVCNVSGRGDKDVDYVSKLEGCL